MTARSIPALALVALGATAAPAHAAGLVYGGTTADTDAAGASEMTCDSGAIAWKALSG